MEYRLVRPRSKHITGLVENRDSIETIDSRASRSGQIRVKFRVKDGPYAGRMFIAEPGFTNAAIIAEVKDGVIHRVSGLVVHAPAEFNAAMPLKDKLKRP